MDNMNLFSLRLSRYYSRKNHNEEDFCENLVVSEAERLGILSAEYEHYFEAVQYSRKISLVLEIFAKELRELGMTRISPVFYM